METTLFHFHHPPARGGGHYPHWALECSSSGNPRPSTSRTLQNDRSRTQLARRWLSMRGPTCAKVRPGFLPRGGGCAHHSHPFALCRQASSGYQQPRTTAFPQTWVKKTGKVNFWQRLHQPIISQLLAIYFFPARFISPCFWCLLEAVHWAETLVSCCRPRKPTAVEGGSKTVGS